MATAGGAWDNAKKWATRCGEEGEPVKWAEGGADLPARQDGVTFANFGIKKAAHFPDLLAEHGLEAFLRDRKTLGDYDTPEKKAALQASLAETYYKRHSATVVGDTLGDPFKDTSGPSLNVLIKTMTMMALMLAPAYKAFDEYQGPLIERARARNCYCDPNNPPNPQPDRAPYATLPHRLWRQGLHPRGRRAHRRRLALRAARALLQRPEQEEARHRRRREEGRRRQDRARLHG